MIKKFVSLGAVVILAGCGDGPKAIEQTNENNVKSSLIAIVDGCRLWEIKPGAISYKVYMARRPEGEIDVRTHVPCGKGCVRPQQTVGAREND